MGRFDFVQVMSNLQHSSKISCENLTAISPDSHCQFPRKPNTAKCAYFVLITTGFTNFNRSNATVVSAYNYPISVSYLPWGDGQPNGGNLIENCVVMSYSDGQFWVNSTIHFTRLFGCVCVVIKALNGG